MIGAILKRNCLPEGIITNRQLLYLKTQHLYLKTLSIRRSPASWDHPFLNLSLRKTVSATGTTRVFRYDYGKNNQDMIGGSFQQPAIDPALALRAQYSKRSVGENKSARPIRNYGPGTMEPHCFRRRQVNHDGKQYQQAEDDPEYEFEFIHRFVASAGRDSTRHYARRARNSHELSVDSTGLLASLTSAGIPTRKRILLFQVFIDHRGRLLSLAFDL